VRLRPERSTRSRTLPLLLFLAALTIMTVDATAGADSPVDRLRGVAGVVFGPVQTGMATAAEPLTAARDFFTTVPRLREENADLRQRNAQLQTQLRTSDVDRSRLAQLETMRTVSREAGIDVVAAQVVGIGPAQSFSRTVTIDAGTADGVEADMTVLNADGLVGRVVRADRGTATVLLIVDADSVVGGRIGSTMELGFLAGDGDLSGDGRLQLTTVDTTVRAAVGDTVVTWGSQDGTPYVAGVPVGRVESVQTNARDSSTVATVVPFVDFSSLDLVSVVVESSGRSAGQAMREGGG
jgi:rod shape-determining protein MreC